MEDQEDDVEIPIWRRDILNERLVALDKNPNATASWTEAGKRLRKLADRA